MSDQAKISRREFIRDAAVVAGAGALAGLGATPALAQAEPPRSAGAVTLSDFATPPAPIAAKDIKETITTDVVVLGGGNAGLAAAVSAAEAGAKTILLQKGQAIAGVGGDIGAVNSRLHKQLNLRIDRDLFVAEICQWATYRNDQSVVTLYVDKSGEVMDWLIDLVEADYSDLQVKLQWDAKEGFYRAFPITHNIVTKTGAPNTIGVRNVLLKKATALGADVRYSTPAVQLVRKEKGRVTGVIAQNAAKEYVQFNARKAVVICSGGYVQDLEMLKAWCPRALWSSDCPGMMVPGNTGDGIKMALWIGAAVDDLPHAPMQFDIGGPVKGIGYPWTGTGGMPSQMNMLRQPWLRVNLRGERYVNEDQPYQYNLNAVFSQPGRMWWGIWDSDWREYVKTNHTTGCARIMPSPGGGWVGNDKDLPAAQKKALDEQAAMIDKNMGLGLVKKADTIEELAKLMDVPAATLKATIERYNTLAKMGKDLDYGKVAFRLTPIVKPPFYAQKGAASLLTTINGLRINSKLQVMDTDQKPIEGLYAAGDASGSFFANDYPELSPGLALGRTITFGRLAGLNAAAEKPTV